MTCSKKIIAQKLLEAISQALFMILSGNIFSTGRPNTLANILHFLLYNYIG